MWKLKQAAKKKAEKMASSVAAPAKESVRIASPQHSSDWQASNT